MNNIEKWMKMYNLAMAYYEHYGNLSIPTNFKTINGYEYDKDGVNLGIWIQTQRQNYKGRIYFSSEKIELLEEINMCWDSRMEKWMEMYNLAKAYYEHYDNLKVPTNFKTKNGYTYDKDGVNLGMWIKYQCQSYKGNVFPSLTPYQIKLLSKIKNRWFTVNNDIKLQDEIITVNNLKRKEIEIQNRFYSLLCKLDNSKLPSKEEINNAFQKRLEIRK